MRRRQPAQTPKRDLRRIARLILDGRMGRACREMARVSGGTPLMLATDEARREWALKILATEGEDGEA